jgi:hypothetical protein
MQRHSGRRKKCSTNAAVGSICKDHKSTFEFARIHVPQHQESSDAFLSSFRYDPVYARRLVPAAAVVFCGAI